MAPDKIFIDEDLIAFHILQTRHEGDVEYIRKDALLEKAKQWFIEHTNIPQEVETNEDGEPLAKSYIDYAKKRFDAANEMFEAFREFVTK